MLMILYMIHAEWLIRNLNIEYYLCVSVYVCGCICVSVWLYMCVSVYVCECIYVRVYMCVCVCSRACVYVCVCAGVQILLCGRVYGRVRRVSACLYVSTHVWKTLIRCSINNLHWNIFRSYLNLINFSTIFGQPEALPK